jgi:methionyl-tRNA synthetase
MKNKFYLTTAIAYASGNPHIGHIYEYIMSDLIVRYKRYIGCDVLFCTGMDEHGQKIAEKALENKMAPKQFVDHICSKFKQLDELYDISYDVYIQTSEPYHCEAVQKVFSELYEKKLIYLGM